ncbi:hypothetical protein LX99_04752 [Mucilaginibacter oryzae]|uniref:Uncharacterized protein n=1 Tax=Mucilaginibacter oryzae TaxID=468058 RepID=A0A316GZ75_9SPHI|nr:hypothetical protein [Mucilaginibacter oryzae]PWK69253.1 hypothetical protein LX99_04752 [Mucilaginibacter oryzae]
MPANNELLKLITTALCNSGFCCFDGGDITGIEIAKGRIRPIKWENNDQRESEIKYWTNVN